MVGLVDASGSGDVAMDDHVDVREEGAQRLCSSIVRNLSMYSPSSSMDTLTKIEQVESGF